ncbi:MAG: hypothetical protein Q9160_006557 [Pyrenula sp. 1 TL-2023]
MSVPSPEDYTIGWVCALQEEYDTACRMLDDEYDPPKLQEANDTNTYTYGRIGKHFVVIGVLPVGIYGESSATGVVTNMRRSFPTLKFALMVGIGGGAPTKEKDIRLGNVVVSVPRGKVGGVVQMDRGKKLPNGQFQRTGQLNSPPQELLTTIPKVQRDYNDPGKMDEVAQNMKLMKGWNGYERPAEDNLYRKDYPHQVGNSCANCTTDNLCIRSPRENEREVIVHYGTIASSNSVMKDAEERDFHAQDAKLNMLCFEMEAAGLMNAIPCLVVRGICDYSDSHKNDDWHKYAALAAAAYARKLFYTLEPTGVNRMPPWAKDLQTTLAGVKEDVSVAARNIDEIAQHSRGQERKIFIDWISSTNFGSQQDEFFSRHEPGTGQWLLESAEFKDWRANSNETLFCPGIPGAGKTILTSIVINDVQTGFREDREVGVAYVYCDYQQEKQPSVQKILENILKQLAQYRPTLSDSLTRLFEQHSDSAMRPAFEDIMTAFNSLIGTFSRVFVFVDALDEYEAESQPRLIQAMVDLQTTTHMNLFATFRPLSKIESEIKNRYVECVWLKVSASPDDLRRYLNTRISGSASDILRRRDLREQAINAIIKVADGMFLLAQLNLDSLMDLKLPRDIWDALDALPEGSTAYHRAYDEALNRLKHQGPASVAFAKKVLSWVSYAKRPLTIRELQHALANHSSLYLGHEKELPSREDILAVCGDLVMVDKDNENVRFIHFTTREYFQNGHMPRRWLADAQLCITKTCITILSSDQFANGRNPEMSWNLCHWFPAYAACFWGYHARENGSLCPEVGPFLQKQNYVDASLHIIEAYEPSEKEEFQEFPNFSEESTGLHLAAWFGLQKEAQTLIDLLGVDAKDLNGSTPLFHAA